MRTICLVMRAVNRVLFRELIRSRGEKAVAHVAVGANVSQSLIEKVMGGTYGRTPAKATRDRLCNFFGVSEDELFPMAPTKGKAQAS